MSEHKLQINEIGTVGERINKLVDHFCKGNKTAFGRAADIQSGVLAGIVGGRGSKPGFEILQKLLTAYPTVDPTWLLFGRGHMLKDLSALTLHEALTAPVAPGISQEEIDKRTEQIEGQMVVLQRRMEEFVSRVVAASKQLSK